MGRAEASWVIAKGSCCSSCCSAAMSSLSQKSPSGLSHSAQFIDSCKQWKRNGAELLYKKEGNKKGEV